MKIPADIHMWVAGNCDFCFNNNKQLLRVINCRNIADSLPFNLTKATKLIYSFGYNVNLSAMSLSEVFHTAISGLINFNVKRFSKPTEDDVLL